MGKTLGEPDRLGGIELRRNSDLQGLPAKGLLGKFGTFL